MPNFIPDFNNGKNITPFKFWCNKVLPLVYDDSLSYYELLCKLVDELNNIIIPSVNNTNSNVLKLYNAFTLLQGYVNNYFDTLDVQTEINNKLDEMASDGTLENIIEPYLNALTTSTYAGDVLLAVFHDYYNQAYSDENRGTGRTPRFYISKNGADFCEFNKSVYPVRVNTSTVNNGWVGAPSICYHNGLFIMSASGNGITQTRDGAIGVSKDLKNWKWYDYTFGVNSEISAPEVQAPHIFVINEKLFMIESCWTGATETNVDGNTTHQYQMWLAEINVTENGVNIVSTPEPINLPDININHIDGMMIQIGNKIYLLCVNDSLKTIEVYSTVNMVDYTLVNKQLFGGIRFEGITACIYNGLINLYADHYATTAGAGKKMFYATTKDFITLENVKTVYADYKYQLRHGDVITISNSSAKKVLRAIEDYNDTANSIVRKNFEYNCNTIKSITDDSGTILYKEIDNLYLTPETDYYFPSNYEYRINNLRNMFALDKCRFIVSGVKAKIKITNSENTPINYEYNGEMFESNNKQNTIIEFTKRIGDNALYPSTVKAFDRIDDINFVGDSITAGIHATKLYHMIIEDITGYNCYNYGLDGAGYNHAVTGERLAGNGNKGIGSMTEISNLISLKTVSANMSKCDTVVIFAGTNDYKNNVPENDFKESLETVYNNAKNKGNKIIICTPTKRQTETANNAELTLSNYCDFIREFVEEKGAILCDLYNDIEYNENLFPDGLHPNNAGHRLIARDLMNYIK